MTNREKTIEKIIAYFEDNEDVFNECIEELDGWNGYLNDDRYYNMDELDDLMHGKSATDLLNMAFFGHDENTFHTDSHGNKEYSAFNPNRDYFTFNGYGNLISSDYKDYSAHLDRYFIEALEEDRDSIYAIEYNEELSELFDELENEDDGNEESEVTKTCR